MNFLGDEMEKSCLSWCNLSAAEEIKGEGRFLFAADFIGFSGHFPKRPILPAVVQLAAVRYLAGRLLGKGVGLHSFRGGKFRDVILPEEEVSVGLSLLQQEDLWRGQFTIVKGEGSRVAEGSAFFIG